ncbi:hypothetical protein HV213_09055 [Klebsiella sp. RHBSTW-00484]|uniref:hypothetical protein n=1 Tax=unclassified Klebsiella TaxID=2608929 RepID=UPI0015E52058|nr:MULTISPECIES: hypothetical protein [unclassified Klebsiella]MBA7848243.1 hypothetical protein [Klebsiella sp. RHBSTW-00465]QLO35961.1 hypothetical protein HV213_09055 [Klebsiella sp. RHBSTW-00484]QLT75477.1 hypothetical protein HV204_09055 [Klebsiella sp. RHBSTW-00464]
MNNSILYSFAVQLCCSDHISGFIPAQPVIDTRENLTEQRLSSLFKLVSTIHNDILSMSPERCPDTISFVFEKSLQLTCSDISCGVIAVEPILYDRDEKIGETIKIYFSRIIEQLGKHEVVIPKDNCSCISKVHNDVVAGTDKILVLPVHKVMKKRKIKKGKR